MAVLALGLVGWLGYQGLTVIALTEHLREQKALLKQEQALTVQLRQAQATTATLRKWVLTHPASWAWGEQLPLTLAQVSGLVKRSGVRVESMQPAPMVEAQKLARFPLRIALRGSLPAIVTFLRLAREQAPALGVDQLTLQTGTLTTDALSAQVTLSSYVVLEGAVGGEKP
jgi:Tfp pilus assembly protein PilO